MSFYAWVLGNWSRAAMITALILIALSPILYQHLSLAQFLVFLQLPIYMIHQYEEHANGKFKIWVNQLMAGGREAMSDEAILVINIVGVWIVDLVSLYLCLYVHLVWGLIAIYLTLINGVIHIAGTLRFRSYNPGLWTSIVLFLPVSILAIRIGDFEATTFGHWISAGIILALHGLIIAHMRIRVAALQKAS